MRSPDRTRISAAKRNSRLHDPVDRELIDPLEIERAKVQDPDPEIVQDPPVCLALAAAGPQMAELMEQEPEQVPLRDVSDQRERADGVRPVADVHDAPLADPTGIRPAEPDDLLAADLELRPGERGFCAGDESADQPEGELKPTGCRSLTG